MKKGCNADMAELGMHSPRKRDYESSNLSVSSTMEEIFDKFEIGDRVMDSDGTIGTVSECDDPHNIFVRFDNGSGLYCVVKGCLDDGRESDYGKLLKISESAYMNREYLKRGNQTIASFLGDSSEKTYEKFEDLKPAIEKIESLGFLFTAERHQCQIFDKSKEYPENFIIDADFKNDLFENAFEGIVSFIEWHNASVV